MIRTYALLCWISLNTQPRRNWPGPKPKTLIEQAIPVIKPLQRMEQSYSQENGSKYFVFSIIVTGVLF